MVDWDGHIPERRYAMFNSLIHGDYMLVIHKQDFNRASKWGGFVQWVGGVRPAETRKVT
jgi:hypothetical protein